MPHTPPSSSASSSSGPRIGVVTASPTFFHPQDPDRDTAPLLAALRERGAVAQAVPWRGAEVDWAGFDLVLIRSTWDYLEDLPGFRTWVRDVSARTRLLNPGALVEWNLDKRYLAQLDRAGIPTVPTRWAATVDDLETALATDTHGSPAFADAPGWVVKPSHGAGSSLTGLFAREDPAARTLGREILTAGAEVMVQPEIPELSAGAEKALYLIDGTLTHAIAKGALLRRGGGLIGGVYQEHAQRVPVTPAEEELARRTLATVSDLTGQPAPLYARIDLVDSARYGLLVLEAEMIEPSLNLHLAPEVAGVLAAAVLRHAV
ncbi:hypothetical protein JSY14_06815 [Brachybacterium sp. EF45031]|uniref:ATP-grasp domain-containing protein n=1 Tax=Brachybacterium sillae TaxID=2810536 RepID=UPI00217ED7D3|nr:hypothetical protein [Brachybacterium sillae]MCS6711745.1 hypothetical protein [Brachybacterium sillae]